MAHDKLLQDHERAHSGKPGSKIRHGQDAVGSPGKPRNEIFDQIDAVRGKNPTTSSPRNEIFDQIDAVRRKNS